MHRNIVKCQWKTSFCWGAGKNRLGTGLEILRKSSLSQPKITQIYWHSHTLTGSKVIKWKNIKPKHLENKKWKFNFTCQSCKHFWVKSLFFWLTWLMSGEFGRKNQNNLAAIFMMQSVVCMCMCMSVSVYVIFGGGVVVANPAGHFGYDFKIFN